MSPRQGNDKTQNSARRYYQQPSEQKQIVLSDYYVIDGGYHPKSHIQTSSAVISQDHHHMPRRMSRSPKEEKSDQIKAIYSGYVPKNSRMSRMVKTSKGGDGSYVHQFRDQLKQAQESSQGDPSSYFNNGQEGMQNIKIQSRPSTTGRPKIGLRTYMYDQLTNFYHPYH